MPMRRTLLTLTPALALAAAAPALAAQESFEAFLRGVSREAEGQGVSPALLRRAFADLAPNQRVLELDRRQAEFTLTWERYRDGRLVPQRIGQGRRMAEQHAELLQRISARYAVSPRIILAVWGLETNYGGFTGSFSTIQALATLAWDGRRRAFFRRELLAALQILEQGDVTPEKMRGSHAGAMGHPQFMPTSFQALAVDFDGDGRRDIWDSRADALASIAHYLSHHGWRGDERWGREVTLPPGFDTSQAGRDTRRPLRDWLSQGIAAADGSELPPLEMETSILLPGGPGGQAFAVYPNFHVIRRYNPSDFYALAIGLLSDQVG
ncbi:lytic transglycosylase domain-containing protein [Pseudoroseomonas cervicalis]|uniref:Lytic murein transglycosylase n=1 Tax=Pseudoroseomonas cervicalis ATCC 49957 TaxID=525371 RepID=D5RQ57_9PROT|nr:lytic murein transglycosylase [Pseudoroseomonas cervicalis]EFH10515.1 lytic murein transglycosylase [Pseudoroseomonas cervicalis ATCC 49957]